MIKGPIGLASVIIPLLSIAEEVFANTFSSDDETTTLADELADSMRDDVANELASMYRIVDFVVYMETSTILNYLSTDPSLPHFVIRSLDDKKKLLADTSFGFYGLTNIGVLEAERQLEKLESQAMMTSNTQLRVLSRSRLLLIDTVAASIEDKYSIPSIQTTYMLVLALANYEYKTKTKDPSFSMLIQDIEKFYGSWQGTMTPNTFTSRIQEYIDLHLDGLPSMFLDTTVLYKRGFMERLNDGLTSAFN